MNILPLVLALVLMLSILTVQQVEKFKNQQIVQNEYREFFKTQERSVFNKREKNLFGEHDKDKRQLTFRYIINKASREAQSSAAAQYRLLNIELIKIVYGSAPFYQELIQKRPHFVEDMIAAIERAADVAPEKTIRRIQDISRLDLGDEELQDAFYHILKGTLPRETMKEVEFGKLPPSIQVRGYPSLFTFINNNGAKEVPKIVIQLSPREILKAIFLDDNVVEAILKKRQELSSNKMSGSEEAFRQEFVDKRRPLIEDGLLDFRISESDKKKYD